MKPRHAAVLLAAALMLGAYQLSTSAVTQTSDPHNMLSSANVGAKQVIEKAIALKLEVTLIVGHLTFKGVIVGKSDEMIAMRYPFRDNQELIAYLDIRSIDGVIVQATP
ncbi:MAG: hypothetical protein ABIJ96_07195 [Elusimicrobiota bacterium]